jgi:hypothetical protein
MENADEIVRFRDGQEAEYEEWARKPGYVMRPRKSGLVVHYSDCSHLALTAGQFGLTHEGRLCCRRRTPLVELAKEQTGKPPKLCDSCF